MGIPIRYICSWMGECQLLPAVGGSCLDKVFLRTCHFDDFSFQFNRVFLPTCPNEQLKKRDCTNKHNLYKYLWNTFRAKTKKPGWWFQPLWKILYSQIGSSSHLLGKIKYVWNHQPETVPTSFKQPGGPHLFSHQRPKHVSLWPRVPCDTCGSSRAASDKDIIYSLWFLLLKYHHIMIWYHIYMVVMAHWCKWM
jgi:hypothetical protein